jgi:hypothetical protein
MFFHVYWTPILFLEARSSRITTKEDATLDTLLDCINLYWQNKIRKVYSIYIYIYIYILLIIYYIKSMRCELILLIICGLYNWNG